MFIATIDARLICLEAATGKPCGDFGTAGQINLRQGIKNILREGEYEETSPPAIIDDLVIVGSSISDNDRVEVPSGVVRAFDTRTGVLRWSWNPIPQDAQDPATKTWPGDSASKTGAGTGRADLADTAVSRRSASVITSAGRPGRCLGADARGPQGVPRTHGEINRRRHFHTAQPCGFTHLSGQRRGHELERLRLPSRRPDPDCEHAPHPFRGTSHPAGSVSVDRASCERR